MLLDANVMLKRIFLLGLLGAPQISINALLALHLHSLPFQLPQYSIASNWNKHVAGSVHKGSLFTSSIFLQYHYVVAMPDIVAADFPNELVSIHIMKDFYIQREQSASVFPLH